MTVKRRAVCLLLVLGLLFSLNGSGLFSAGADSATLGMTTADKVVLRYGPSTSEKIIFYLPANYVCTIVSEKVVQNVRWYRVEALNPDRNNNTTYTGYVHGSFFRHLTDAEAANYSTGSTPTSGSTTSGSTARSTDLTAKSGSIGSVTAGGTNLREGPGTGYKSLMKLDRNTQVELLTIPSVRGNGSGTFFKVRYNNITGYIMSDFISILSGGPESGAVTVATPTPTPKQGGTSATPTPTPAPSGTGTITHVKLILSSCHLRVSPGGDYDSDNDWVGQGSVLPITGSGVKQGGYTWYPVAKNGKIYYVRNDCVQLISDGSTPTPTPAGGATPTPTPAPTGKSNVLGYVRTIVGGCNLRATINGTVIKQIPKNVTLPYLLEPVQKNGYTWYFVQSDANKGYLRGDVVKVVSKTTGTATATITPVPENTVPPTGYVKTIAAGVNLRKSAGFTDVIGQVQRNVVLPYYGTPVTVKGVQWYKVIHPSLGTGYLHGSYVNLCNSDGTDIAAPVTAAPTGSSNVTPAPSGQEASYTTLKLGSTGTAVKNLITELKNQGYYTGTIGTKYTSAVESAVKAFQRAKGLTVDGIAGAATQHKLFGTVPVGAGDTSNLTMTLYPAEKIDWYTGGINEMWARGSNYKVYDVKTGIVWWAHRWAGGLHVDAEPLTAADTARLCKCYGVSTSQEIKDKNLYQRRPLLVTIGTRTFACSLYGVPHNYPEGDTISTNDFRGQVCIHFSNSKTHDSQKVDSLHAEAIQYAWEHAPNGHR